MAGPTTTGLPVTSIYADASGIYGRSDSGTGGGELLSPAETRELLGLGAGDNVTFAQLDLSAAAVSGQTPRINIGNGIAAGGSGHEYLRFATNWGSASIYSWGGRMKFDGGGAGAIAVDNLYVTNTGSLGFTSGDSYSAAKDAYFMRDGAGHISVRLNDSTYGAISLSSVICSAPARAGVYTVATLPSASLYDGYTVAVSDQDYKQAYSDGTDWRYVGTDSVVS